MATEVSNSAWNEVDASNNQTPPAGWPEGQASSTVNDCARMMMGALKRWWNRINATYASTGSANAYVLTPTAALAAYVTGEIYSLRANFTNTASATLNISGLGAKTIKKYTAGGKVNLGAGDLVTGQPVQFCYDGTDMVLMAAPTAPKKGATSRDLSLATGTQAITGVGFKPRYVQFFANVTGNAATSIGQDDGGGAACIFNEHNILANTWNRNATISIFMRMGSGVQQTATIQSMDADGFTISWVKTGAPTGTADIYYVAFP